MTNTDTDLIILEQLSKQISDLIHNNSFENIKIIDEQRKLIISNFKNNNPTKSLTRNRVIALIHKNDQLISNTQDKLIKLQKDKNKFEKRLETYSANT